jgi:hypothetical protein
MFYHCTCGFKGTTNDMTSSRYDTFIQAVNNGTLYANVEYQLLDIHGVPYTVKGCWILCDGGYHKWRAMQCPVKIPIYQNEKEWSEMMESMRKDVECAFGILKGRFRILKYGFRIMDRAQINNVVHTCMTLHNMLIEWDGNDVWETDLDYLGVDGEHEADVLEAIRVATGCGETDGDFCTNGAVNLANVVNSKFVYLLHSICSCTF